MFIPCPPGVVTPVAGDGTGPSCALVVAQPPADPGGWVCELQAECGEGFFLVRRLMLPAPFRGTSRVVAAVTFPGARRWQAQVQAPAGVANAIRVAVQPAQEPFALGELDAGAPGSRGYSVAAALGAAVVAIPPGARVRELAAIGDPLGTGTVTLDVWRDAQTSQVQPAVPLPTGGLIWNMPRQDLDGLWLRSVTFANTVSHVVAWVE